MLVSAHVHVRRPARRSGVVVSAATPSHEARHDVTRPWPARVWDVAILNKCVASSNRKSMAMRYGVMMGLAVVMLLGLVGCSSSPTAGPTVVLPSNRMPPKEGDTFPKPPDSPP